LADLSSVQPLEIPHQTDYHCHCDYSADAEGTIKEYCEAALKRGLAEICFTTHYDTKPDSTMCDCFIRIDGKLFPGSPERLAPYVRDVRAAHDEFYGYGLTVKLGVEIGWWEGCEESTALLLTAHDFDYVLGGIHELGDINICTSKVEQNIARLSGEELIEQYFRQAILAARSGLFTSLAHIGYYRRHALAYFGDIINTAPAQYLPDLFDALKATDTGLEINTSAMRHGLDEYYPPLPIINAAKKAGVTVARLGSDAHRPDQVGFDFEGAAPLIAEHMPYYDE